MPDITSLEKYCAVAFSKALKNFVVAWLANYSQPVFVLVLVKKTFFLQIFKINFFCSSIDFVCTTPSGDCSVFALLQSNEIEIYNAAVSLAKPQFSSLKRLYLVGHRTESRSSCFTSDGFGLLTASSETAKLWNRFRND